MDQKPANNSQFLAIIVVVIVVAAGFFAVRSLTKEANVSKSEKASAHSTADSTDSNSDSADENSRDHPKIKALDANSSRKKDNSGKKIELGETGAAIQTESTTRTAMANALSSATRSTTVPTTILSKTTETTDPVEIKKTQQRIADLAERFKNEKDVDARIDIADDLGLIDDPESVKRVLELLQGEKDPSVKEALLQALSGLDALEETGNDVVDAITKIYQSSTESEVHTAAQDVLGDIGTPQSAALLKQQYEDKQALPEETLNAAENLLRLHASDPSLLSNDEAQGINDRVKAEFQAGTDTQFREQAAMTLAINGHENLPFLQQALTTEKDPAVKGILERLVRIFGTAH